jgi:hypothetical protein
VVEVRALVYYVKNPGVGPQQKGGERKKGGRERGRGEKERRKEVSQSVSH